MTGFGVADGPFGGGRIQVEIRTVNHRHLNVQLRVPSVLATLEEPARTLLRQRLDRGHVTLNARWLEEPERVVDVRVDIAKARALAEAFHELKRTLDLPGDVDLGFIARQPDVLVSAPPDREVSLEAAPFLDIVGQALDAVEAMRAREGAALTSDLRARLEAIREQLQVVRARAPERVTAERDRLRVAVAELLDGRQIDPDRLAQEVAMLAERLDISEEIVRLTTHLEATDAALGQSGPVGRTLGFLGQEMLREINTIGSKANDAIIAQAVIAMKGALEQFREQLENLE